MKHSTKRENKRLHWRGIISAQQRSGLAVRGFCQQQGICEKSFYMWRRSFEQEQPAPARFALVETGPEPKPGREGLELVVASGARLRIGTGADADTLRMVLEALRA